MKEFLKNPWAFCRKRIKRTQKEKGKKRIREEQEKKKFDWELKQAERLVRSRSFKLFPDDKSPHTK